MAFRIAKPKQSSLKLALYGKAGSGKTYTSLLIAEGLSLLEGKRIAYVDTERGTDFYAKDVPQRTHHPSRFDFDAIYTRSITKVAQDVRGLNPKEHCVIVIDSITHLWEAAQESYTGRRTKIGTLPIHAWAQIKRPYKDLVTFLLNSPLHVIICGREGSEFETEEGSGETKKVGTKMKAEGETAYEPHILLHLEALKSRTGAGIITAFAEKDRTGILAQKTIQWPNYENIIVPILPVLGVEQGRIETHAETTAKDAENLADAEQAKADESAELLKRYSAEFDLVRGNEQLETVSKSLSAAVKRKLLPAHVKELRNKYRYLLKTYPKPS